MKKIFLYFIFIFFCLITLTACSSNNNQNIEVEKGLSEIIFLENQIITTYKKYLFDEYVLKDGNVDWDGINEDFDVALNSIDVILIDFASIQVPSKNIVELENNFNDMESFIGAQDLNGFIQKICDSYYLVSNSILDNISEDEEIKLEKKAKSNLLYIGYYLKNSNRDECLKNIENFQENYSRLSTNKKYVENSSYKINKIFINIQDLKSEVDVGDFEKANKTLTKIFEIF